MSSFICNRRYQFSLYRDGQLIDRRNGRLLKDDCDGTRNWLYAKSSVLLIEGGYVLRDIHIDYVDLENGKIEFTAMVKRLKEEE